MLLVEKVKQGYLTPRLRCRECKTHLCLPMYASAELYLFYCSPECLVKKKAKALIGSEERVAKYLSRLQPSERAKYYNQPVPYPKNIPCK